ncbi:Cyst_wall protein [Hexamita inflata]|uniref:Cyst_wall protein n=1 Tax=Hexamita inflata TaxID=28002 RepID=A0ABP1GYQ5_9EUKA
MALLLTIESQIAALTNLFTVTGGNVTWTNTSNWFETNHCSWFGVTCDQNQNVVKLLLRNNGLTNRIPEDIMQLSYLQELDLSENVFFTRIPVQICQLKDCKQILLNRNNIQDEIPQCMCEMQNLEVLDVSNNNISGYLPNCLRKTLHANCNNIHNEISYKLANMSEIDVRCNTHITNCDDAQLNNNGVTLCGEQDCEESCENTQPNLMCKTHYSYSDLGYYVHEDHIAEFLKSEEYTGI